LDKKEKYRWIFIISIIIGFISLFIAYSFYTVQIAQSLATIQGIWEVLIVMLIKIGIISAMAFSLIRKWFKQEEQYPSDIPFLFGLFFLILIYAKFLDILIVFNFYALTPDAVLSLIKFRYFVAIFDLLPMIYLSVGMILYYLSLKERFNAYSESTRLDKARQKILLVIIAIEAALISFAPTFSAITTILPILVLPALITIVWLFAFAYKNKRLSQVHPLIIAIGFLIYLTATISRPIAQRALNDVMYALFSETFEVICFLIIFIGLVVRVNYKIEV
jgi:hypothetical protein